MYENPRAASAWMPWALVCLIGVLLCPFVEAQQKRRSATLDETKARYIWDMEHATFKLDTFVGKPMLKALRAGQAETVATFLTESFRGTLFSEKAAVEHREIQGLRRVRHLDPSPEARRTVDAAGWSAHLVEAFARFSRFDRAKVKVLRIDRDGDAWDCGIRFRGIGADHKGRPIEYEVVFDAIFRFPDTDHLAQDARIIERLDIVREHVSTSETSLLVEVTEDVGLDELSLPDNWELPVPDNRNHRFQMAVEDYDGDGWLDIAIASIHDRPVLLRSLEGKRYEDVTERMGLVRSNLAVESDQYALLAWIDFDDDGYADLLVGNRLYRNLEGQRFADATAASQLEFNRSPFGALVADFDLDGDVDLYIFNQKGFDSARRKGPRPWVGDPGSGALNQLWLNDGRGRFTDVTEKANAGGGRQQTFAANVLFYDADHYPDLYLANDFGANSLLRNKGDGTFEDITRRSGAGSFATSMGVSSGDLNNDGLPELYVANMYSEMGRRIVAHIEDEDYLPGIYGMIQGSLAGNQLFTRDADGKKFQDLSRDRDVNEVGWAYAPTMVDLDGNGLLDLYATTGYASYDPNAPDG